MIRVYKGSEIGILQIMELKYIAANKYDEPIYENYFSHMDDVYSLASMHDTYVDDEILVLGSGWFLCYSIIEDTVSFLEWVSLDNPHLKLKQTAEMLEFFKRIFIENEDKLFVASMRHNTSYKIYSYLKNKGYFSERDHEVFVDCASSIGLDLDDCEAVINTFLVNENLLFDDLLEYILHGVEFSVTDKLVKKCYQRKRIKS